MLKRDFSFLHRFLNDGLLGGTRLRCLVYSATFMQQDISSVLPVPLTQIMVKVSFVSSGDDLTGSIKGRDGMTMD